MTIKALLLFFTLSLIFSDSASTKNTYDIIVYGGTSAGIVAAIQAKKMGETVLVIEPSSHIGGLTTGGLGATDIGNKHVIGGISRTFYQEIFKKYQEPSRWKYQDRSDYINPNQEPSQWTFEPSIAMEVFNDWIDKNDLEIIKNERLKLSDGVVSENGKIISILMESGRKYHAKVFIDATYEGDLMAASNVSYTIGRESNEQYGETLNGVQTQHAIYHQFPDGVSPYIVPDDPNSCLLPNVNPSIANDGTADHRVQGFCFRMCITNVPENRIKVDKPENYSESEYELLFRTIEAGYNGPFFIMSMMPNHKTDANNKGPFSSDYIGQNFDYPDGNYEERKEIISAHEKYQKGLLWTLSYHSRIPLKIRNEFSKWGLPKDEYNNNDNWSPQLYIREARRMVSDFVMTEQHCTQEYISADESIGMGAYTMDSHHMQRYVNENGHVKNEGDVEVGGFSPYPISYKSIVPKRKECSNLIVPVCLSASHIAFGSIRMEPVFMILGQSAATAASIAIENKIAVQDVEYSILEKHLLKYGQILNY